MITEIAIEEKERKPDEEQKLTEENIDDAMEVKQEPETWESVESESKLSWNQLHSSTDPMHDGTKLAMQAHDSQPLESSFNDCDIDLKMEFECDTPKAAILECQENSYQDNYLKDGATAGLQGLESVRRAQTPSESAENVRPPLPAGPEPGMSSSRESPQALRRSSRLGRRERKQSPSPPRAVAGRKLKAPDDDVSFARRGGCLSRTCRVCGKVFRVAKAMTKHFRAKHGDENPFICNVCGKLFKNTSCLNTHMLNHTGKKSYVCHLCGKSFFRKDVHARHLGTHDVNMPHATHRKSHSCDLCGKVFSEIHAVKRHYRTHTGEKPYKCEVCGKGFAQKVDVKKHSSTHSDTKPFRCIVCDQAFTRKSSLLIHHRIHSKKKPHECNFCGRKFARRDVLTVHERSHTGEHSYVCNVCGKTFLDKSSLTGHCLSNKCSGLLNCGVCGLEFSRQSQLRAHSTVCEGE